VNFSHYDPARVNKVYALEPNPGMLRHAEKRRRQTRLDIKFLDLPGERIPLSDASVDTVVSTSTFCTIPGVVEAIQGIARVLKLGGKLIFFELGLSPDLGGATLAAANRTAFPLGIRRPPRDIPSLIGQGGFKIEQMEAAYLAPFPKSGSYCWWGVAVPEANSPEPDEPVAQPGRCGGSVQRGSE
jgi:SAM-dependent methyltransferase